MLTCSNTQWRARAGEKGSGDALRNISSSFSVSEWNFKDKRPNQLAEETAFSLSTCFHAGFFKSPLKKSCIALPALLDIAFPLKTCNTVVLCSSSFIYWLEIHAK